MPKDSRAIGQPEPHLKPLRDVVTLRPRVLFVGINPGLRSAALGHHFAGSGNPFWRLLFAAGLLPVELTFQDDWRLSEFGLALTNLCARPTRSSSDLTAVEMDQGKSILRAKIRRMKPRLVALVGVTIYRICLPDARDSGPGPKDARLEDAPVYVLPNPSGRNANYPGFGDKLPWFEGLRATLTALERAPGPRAV